MLLYELILFRDGGCFASSNEIDTEYLSQKWDTYKVGEVLKR